MLLSCAAPYLLLTSARHYCFSTGEYRAQRAINFRVYIPVLYYGSRLHDQVVVAHCLFPSFNLYIGILLLRVCVCVCILNILNARIYTLQPGKRRRSFRTISSTFLILTRRRVFHSVFFMLRAHSLSRTSHELSQRQRVEYSLGQIKTRLSSLS